MKKFKMLIRTFLALFPVVGVLILGYYLITADEVVNDGELNVVLGLLIALSKDSYTWFFNGSKDDD